MKSFVVICIVGELLVGCDAAPKDPETAPDTSTTQVAPTTPETGGNSSVQIHTGGAGGIAPVTGSENLGGGGGGVNQAAKDSARNAAAKAGGSSLDQLGTDTSE